MAKVAIVYQTSANNHAVLEVIVVVGERHDDVSASGYIGETHGSLF